MISRTWFVAVLALVAIAAKAASISGLEGLTEAFARLKEEMSQLVIRIHGDEEWNEKHGNSDWIHKLDLKTRFGKQCCGKNDCEIIRDIPGNPPKPGVSSVDGNYRINSTGEIIEARDVIWVIHDGNWWRCISKSEYRKDLTRCLIGPLPAT